MGYAEPESQDQKDKGGKVVAEINIKRLIEKNKFIGVRCEGCGEKILTTDDLKEVEYVKTKRKTEIFFHRGCMNKIWRK